MPANPGPANDQLTEEPPNYAGHTLGDIYDNAVTETANGYYKAKLLSGPVKAGARVTINDLEIATLGWAHCHNTGRLHSYLGDAPPAEFKESFSILARLGPPLLKCSSRR